MSEENYEIKIHSFINEVNEKSWNNIASSFFMSTDYLLNIENLDLAKNPQYIEITLNSQLVGAAVTYIQDNSLYASLDESIYGKHYKKISPFFRKLNPCLLCYNPYSPFYEMFSFKEGTDKKEIFKHLNKSLNDLRIKNKCKSYGFLGVTDKEILTLVNSNNLISFFSGFKMRLNLKGNTFDDYLDSLSGSKKRNIKREIKKFKELGGRVEVNDSKTEVSTDVLKVFEENFAKYDLNDESKYSNEFLLNLEKLNKKPILFKCYNNENEICASSMYLKSNNSIIGLRIGQNAYSNKYFFFTTALYEPIKLAYYNNLEYLDLGTGNYKYKQIRGAEPIKTYSLFNQETFKLKNIIIKRVFYILNKRNLIKHYKRLEQ